MDAAVRAMIPIMAETNRTNERDDGGRSLGHLATPSKAVPGLRGGSVSAVHVSAVLDAQHDDFAILLVDPVQDPIGPATCGVDAGELTAEGFADSMRVVDECTGQELDDCGSHRFS